MKMENKTITRKYGTTTGYTESHLVQNYPTYIMIVVIMMIMIITMIKTSHYSMNSVFFLATFTQKATPRSKIYSLATIVIIICKFQ